MFSQLGERFEEKLLNVASTYVRIEELELPDHSHNENVELHLPDGKYLLTLTFPGRQNTSGDTPKPTIRTFLLTVAAVRGEPLKKDLDLKAGQPSPSTLKKLPGKRKPPTITLKRGMTRSVQYTVEGVITLG